MAERKTAEQSKYQKKIQELANSEEDQAKDGQLVELQPLER